MQYDYSEETFKNAQNNYNKYNDGSLNLTPLECALDIFILLQFSYYSDKQSFITVPKESRTDEDQYKGKLKSSWGNKLLPLYRISQRLKNVNISCSDAFYFIKKHNKKPNTLFYIDSPYFFSEDIYDSCETKDADSIFPHKKLADYLKKIHSSNNYFVASNRVTISNTRKKNNNWTNDKAIAMANLCFAHPGFHYTLHRAKNKRDKNKTQVEIIVANFSFKNSIPFYNEDGTLNPVTEERVNACILEKDSRCN